MKYHELSHHQFHEYVVLLFYQELFNIGVIFLFSLFLSIIILMLSYNFSTYNPDTEKVSAYECGFDPY
jgi:NADH:ubiquinone oxidoreductase subunit 3 (subunit A)